MIRAVTDGQYAVTQQLRSLQIMKIMDDSTGMSQPAIAAVAAHFVFAERVLDHRTVRTLDDSRVTDSVCRLPITSLAATEQAGPRETHRGQAISCLQRKQKTVIGLLDFQLLIFKSGSTRMQRLHVLKV